MPRALGPDGTGIFTQFHSELEGDFDSLDELLRGIAAVGELTPRTSDHVAAYGELLSSKIVAGAFLARGLDAVMIDSRECIITDSAHTRAAPLFEETTERLKLQLEPLLTTGRVPVMGGFIGATKAGVTTTIGRGGSDLTAIALAATLKADACEIYKDVDGVCTTDPRLVPGAKILKAFAAANAYCIARSRDV